MAFDRNVTELSTPSGAHKTTPLSKDKRIILMELLDQNIFKQVGGRKHNFLKINSSLLRKLTSETLKDWIETKVKDCYTIKQ